MRAITAICSYDSPTAMICLDTWQGAAMGVQCTPTNSGAFNIDYSFDNPNDLISPIALADMAWDQSMIPAGARNSFSSITFSLPTAPIWIRLSHINGVGQSRMVVLQLGVHSRSNILAPLDIVATGPNLAAVHNGGPR